MARPTKEEQKAKQQALMAGTTEATESTTIKAEVVASTLDDEKTESKIGSDVVYISCGIRGSHKFDDLGDNGRGIFVLNGIDTSLRGSKGGILSADGNAVLLTMPRKTWEEIIAKHGNERMFKGDGTHAPLVFEAGSKEDFKARRDEIATSITGLAPKSFDDLGVTEAVKNA